MKKHHNRVCPSWLVWTLDNFLRRIVHNPKKLFGKYVKEGMTALDIGCGSGLFSVGLAKLVGESGKVIAADLQESMLDRVRRKIKGKEFGKRVRLHKCEPNKIGVSEKVDFVLSFWMAHEVPDQVKFFSEIKSILKGDSVFFLIEPKHHVTRKEFEKTEERAVASGFKVFERPKIFLSRSAVFSRKI